MTRIDKIHLSVLFIGFVIGFGFVPEVRNEFGEIIPSAEIITETQPDPNPVPNRSSQKPKSFAILNQKQKWNQ